MKKKIFLPKLLIMMLMAVVSLFGTVTALSENDIIATDNTPLYYFDLSHIYSKNTAIDTFTPTDVTTPTDVSPTDAGSEVVVQHPPEIVSLSEEAQQRLTELSNKFGCVATQIAVIDDGYVTSLFSSGYANLRRKTAINNDTKIRVASLSKVLVGMSAMAAQEDGFFDLDDPLTDVLGYKVYNPNYSKHVLTMRSFLTHTASVNMTATISNVKLEYFLRSRDTYFSTEPNKASAWCYSNPGIRAAGGMVEQITGRTLPEFDNERFFTPLGADASFFASLLKDRENIATLYGGDHIETQSVNTLLSRNYSTVPGENGFIFAGGLMISAQDFAKLMCILLRDGEYDGHRILNPATVAEMEQVNYELKDFDQCIILRHRDEIYGRELYFHTGDAYGVLAFAAYDQASGEGVVVVTVGAGCGRDKYDIPTVCGEMADYIFNEVLDGKRAES